MKEWRKSTTMQALIMEAKMMVRMATTPAITHTKMPVPSMGLAIATIGVT
jgi:hypothetical protein